MLRRGFLSGLAGLSLLQLPVAPALSRQVNKFAEELKNGEFSWFPERSPAGPVLIIVSIPEQRVHVYRNGIRIAASTCSTGRKGHATPTGVFSILQKDKNHKSATYDDAPMPNMNRLTWDGIALHAGNLPGYPASHGCVRLPLAFSELLFGVTALGMTVIIADENRYPTSVVHPGMILGDDVLVGYKAAEAAILKREYSAGHAVAPKITTMIASSADRKLTILEDGREVASGRIRMDSRSGRKLGERVYTLTGSDQNAKSLNWISADMSRQGQKAASPSDILDRFTAESRLRDEARARMHLGMNVITTDRPAGHRTRTGPGFVILTSGAA